MAKHSPVAEITFNVFKGFGIIDFICFGFVFFVFILVIFLLKNWY